MEDMKMAVVQPHGGTQLTAAATAGPATLVLRKIKWCLRDKWRISVQNECFLKWQLYLFY